MRNDLIERYIYAVTKRLPAKSREDVSQELSGLIDDMLSERCEGEPTEQDIRNVLTELGKPDELYAKYGEDAEKCLIGQPYYSTYKFVLKIVMISAAAGLTVAGLVNQIMEPQHWLMALDAWVGMVCEGLVASFAFVTFLFAYFHRKGIKLEEKFSLDDLPAVPQKKQEIPLRESAVSIAMEVIFLVVFLAVPQIFSVILTKTNTVIPIFDAQAIREEWFILVLFALAGIAREGVKLVEKQYNRKVMVTAVVADLISAALSFAWLADSRILNPEFTASVHRIFVNEAEIIYAIFDNFNVFFLGVILLALVLDAGTAVVKAIKK